MEKADKKQKNTPVKKEKPAKQSKAPTLAKKNKFGVAFVLKMICILAMALFIGSLFLDFWTYETYSKEDYRLMVLYDQDPEPIQKTISINEYVWMTKDCEDLFGDPESDPEAMRRVHNAWTDQWVHQNDIVGMPFISTVLILFALIFFLLNIKSVWPSILSLGAGVYALLALIQDKAGVYKPWSGTVTINKGNILMPEYVEKPFTAGISYNLVLIAAGVLTVASLAVFVVWVIRVIKWFTVKEVRY